MSLVGDLLAVAAFYADLPTKVNAGAVYVYERQPDGSWSNEQKIIATLSRASDWFGWSIALLGESLA